MKFQKLFNCLDLIIVIITISVLVSCVNVIEESDSQSPDIQIMSPFVNAELNEPTYIHLEATDNVGVISVEIFIDGSPIIKLKNEPWEWVWHVSFYADGNQHSIEAKAVDLAGNVGESEIVNVFVPVTEQADLEIIFPVDQQFITNTNLVELKWSKFLGASEYNIMVFSDINYSIIEYFLTTSDTVITIEQTAEGRQFWKVQPKNSGIKYGNWSETKSFYFGNTVEDIDGNIYLTTIINGQEWMAEDLKVSHYQNGDPIYNPLTNEEWIGQEAGMSCWYNNTYDSSNSYGLLYNWNAIMDSRNIAPEGWHIPTDEEWQTMVNHLSGITFAGGKIKEIGTAHWARYNIGATNETGFTALPGGYRLQDGTFRNRGSYGYYGTATESTDENAWYWKVQYDGRDLYRYEIPKQTGLSVRCVKD